MPDIKDSVGEGGTNAVHDVALVQLMLHVVKNAKKAPYLAVGYTGTYGAATKDAIIAFQQDQNLVAPPPPPGAKPPPGGKIWHCSGKRQARFHWKK